MLFVLKYTLTDAMNYENSDRDRDRLYWNIVTDYEVSISDMTVDVYLPGMYRRDDVFADAYSSVSTPNEPEIHSTGTVDVIRYYHSLVDAREDYTIDIYFPSTVVRRPPNMVSTMAQSYTMLTILGTIGACFFLWYQRRREPKPPTTVEPASPTIPEGLRPPEAGVLIR